MRSRADSMRGGVRALFSLANWEVFVPVHGTKSAIAKTHY
jgi:hypothetical protein